MTAALRKTVDQEQAFLLDRAEQQFTLHDFEFIDLRAARSYLQRRVDIALVKWEHGLLTAEEQDALILESAELRERIELWRACR